MSWLRLDDGFVEHPKLGALTDREFRVWVRTLCYCARTEDPTVDQITIKNVAGLTPRFVSKLESLLLLDTHKNGYEIHDWIHYQPKDKTGAERQARYRSRRHQQAKEPRDATVTPTVTETVTPRNDPDRDENITSRARDTRTRTQEHNPEAVALDAEPPWPTDHEPDTGQEPQTNGPGFQLDHITPELRSTP